MMAKSNNLGSTNDIYFKYSSSTVKNFPKYKDLKFQDFKERLNGRKKKCFFKKKTDEEFFVIIPVDDEELKGYVEFVVKYSKDSNYFLEIQVEKRKKSRFNDKLAVPDLQYAFEQLCTLHFVEKESGISLSNLLVNDELANKAFKLNVSPVVEYQKIWEKYIEAQEIIVKDLEKPYACKGYKEDDKKFNVQLYVDNNSEYFEFENELKNQLQIEESFDADGSIKLKYDDIIRGLDLIIKKKFSKKLEREKKIGCILTIEPVLKECIKKKYASKSFHIEQNNNSLIFSDIDCEIDEFFKSLDEDFNLSRTKTYLEFNIRNIDNLFTSKHINQYKISFDTIVNKDQTPELILPRPINSTTFRVSIDPDKDVSKQYKMFQNILPFIYGEDNINKKVLYEFSKKDDTIFKEESYKEIWNDINRDLYALDFEITRGEGTGNSRTIYFEFETKEELEKMYKSISNTDKFHIAKSPLDKDFKFKVKTKLLAQKTKKEIFEEKLKKLSRIEFLGTFEGFEKIPIGTLKSKESTMSQLVFKLPSNKENAEKFKKCISEHPKIIEVTANLVGDRKKIGWLKEAMHKVSDDNDSIKPNSKPINDKIKEFIFDSSKAMPINRYEVNDIENCDEYKNFNNTSILSLNDSQKKSVLRALHASDLCMLQGPPGTGKTTVIAELIWQHIRTAQKSRILLTSETNLAVDNAIEKLMNEKKANSKIVRYLTLIKPLRFGKSSKLEEEGKRFSIERIMKWVGGKESPIIYEEEPILGEQEEFEEEYINDNINDNVVQRWMCRIAEYSAAKEARYSEILNDWVMEMSKPSEDTKKYFTDKFFKYANVIGSTCCSTGSTGFKEEYKRIFNSDEKHKKIREIKYLINEKPSSPKISKLIEEIGLDYIETSKDNNFEKLKEAIKNFDAIRFDTVIMDEASKATPPEILVPLCFGKKSIIIGDHRQLPPMLYDKDFKETLHCIGDKEAEELSEFIDKDFTSTSQFKRLILNPNVSPTIKSTFNEQYRMHKDINAVIKQFYKDDESGGLVCGLDPKDMDDPDLNNPGSRYHGLFHEEFIEEKIHTIWVDVKGVEEADGTSTINHEEVKAMKRVLAYLKNSRGWKKYMDHWKTPQEKEVGLISFYGKQVAQIKEHVGVYAKKMGIPVKINTVDKFQGMERNIIIVSTVRTSKAKNSVGEKADNKNYGFASSPERLNVALSRAKRLLIVIGDKDFFAKGKPIYYNAIKEIRKSGRIIDFKQLTKYADNE